MNEFIEVKRDLYVNTLEILAPKTKIDLVAWILLYKMYGRDIFYILNLMAGQNIKVPSHRTIVDAIKNAKLKEYDSDTLKIPLVTTGE